MGGGLRRSASSKAAISRSHIEEPGPAAADRGFGASSVTACITAVSKSRWMPAVTGPAGACTRRTATSFAFGSTQKWVPNAPSQPKLPSDRNVPARTASDTTSTVSPNPIPFGPPSWPPNISPTWLDDISSTAQG